MVRCGQRARLRHARGSEAEEEEEGMWKVPPCSLLAACCLRQAALQAAYGFAASSLQLAAGSFTYVPVEGGGGVLGHFSLGGQPDPEPGTRVPRVS